MGPPRQSVAESGSPARDVDVLPAALPGMSALGQGFPGLKGPRAGARSGRQLPARLQALDDQTVMPRDVYDNMLKLGDTTRGRLGCGQHKLTFVGSEGVPVLRIAA